MREVICDKIMPALGVLLIVGAFFLCFIPPLHEKGDELLEPFCTKTLPSLVPQRLQEPGTMLNPRNWHFKYDWDKIQTGTFPKIN